MYIQEKNTPNNLTSLKNNMERDLVFLLIPLFFLLKERFKKTEYPFKADKLLKFGTDLTSLATKGKLDPMIGREAELEQLVQVLCSRRKNNACLTGDPGVGKTAVVEGLATMIANGTAPKKLIGKKVFSIEMSRILAASKYHGMLEQNLVDLVDEVVQSNGSVILFIDELHTVIRAGDTQGTIGAANVLKPALARGELRCVGATTLAEYREYFEKDKALKRRFQAIDVPEPSPAEAIKILQGLQNKYETHHGVTYTCEALIAAVDLTKQYISDRFLPDKAIDLMDVAGTRVQLRKGGNNQTVTEGDMQQVISMWTRIPLEKVTFKESHHLLAMDKVFKQRIIGQDEAVSSVCRAIRRARVGLRDMTQPVATFLFTGPTGVGKTELAKVLAEEYSKEAMVRLDMSEYMEPHTVSRLFGSPPGYLGHDVGGQLTEAVRRRPHAVVLFEEIEKAHSSVFNVLLQILDDGRLTDGKGSVVDFTNAIVIFTSNIGGQLKGEYEEVRRGVGVELKRVFKPELLNRLDEIVVFRPLEMVHFSKIVDVMLGDFHRRAEKKGIKVEVGNELKELLVSKGCNTSYGARPIRRAITRLLEDPLAERILSEGHNVRVDVNSQGKVVFNC